MCALDLFGFGGDKKQTGALLWFVECRLSLQLHLLKSYTF